MSGAGKWLVVAGVLLVLVGLLTQTGIFSWFGRLPGDIRIERPNSSFYFPIVSMLVISVVGSVVLSLLLHIARRFF
jgi:membrane protein implicated in regulation of membrane protease activity